MKIFAPFILILCVAAFPTVLSAACSRANLTRCLDSACAINIGANPAARCQYCGTSSAGTPTVQKSMRNVAVGATAKYNISDKDLKKAPSDPGARYIWATKQCLAKVSGCNADDVSEIYDSLIEQSCTAAGVSAQMSNAQNAANKKVSQKSCDSIIRTCVIDEKHCMADWKNCKTDTEFANVFAVCGLESGGCDEYLSTIRADLDKIRINTLANADKIIDAIVANYRDVRSKKMNNIRQSCKTGDAHKQCIISVCKNNLKSECAPGSDNLSMAEQLCGFYNVACGLIK